MNYKHATCITTLSLRNKALLHAEAFKVNYRSYNIEFSFTEKI